MTNHNRFLMGYYAYCAMVGRVAETMDAGTDAFECGWACAKRHHGNTMADAYHRYPIGKEAEHVDSK